MRCPAILCLLPCLAAAQTAELSLSPGALRADGSVTMTLSLGSTSGASPAAVQWSLEYPSSTIVSLTVEDGPTAAAAQKTVMCVTNSRGCVCLVLGLNAEPIPDGTLAWVSAKLAPGAAGANIQVTNALAASGGGDAIAVTPSGGEISEPSRTLLPQQRRPPPKRGTAGR